jgi:hypothetical protein
VASFSPFHLQSCLIVDSQKGCVPNAIELWGHSEIKLGQRGNSGHIAGDQCLPLISADTRDQ